MKRAISLIVLAGLSPLAAAAQEAEPGGVYFTLDFGQSFEASTDRDLTTEDQEDGLVSLSTFRFGAVTETRSERLAFEFGAGLRLAEGEFTDDSLNAGLAYSRNSADAQFDVSLTSQREDIAFLRDASDFEDDDGVIVLPDDFSDLFGAGIRAETTLAASLTWGETTPVGYTISASQSLLRYEDANAALVDSDSATLGFGMRLNINEVTTGNIALSYAQTDEATGAFTDRTTLSGAVTFDRPLGDITAQLSVSRDELGEFFWAASVEQEYALPNGTLNGALGLVEDDGGDPRLTGRISFSFPHPTGQFDLAAVHSLGAGDDRTTTTFSASYLHDLGPISSMRIDFDFARESDTDGGDPLSTGSLSASYGISLTEEWQLNIGASTSLRDDAGFENRSNDVFLTLERPFSWRP